MQKFKVPMKCSVERIRTGTGWESNPYDESIRVTLTPQPVQQSFNISPNVKCSADHVHLTFQSYVRGFLKVDTQTLYAIQYMLKSARVDNAFDMLTLTKQLLPMLDEVIAQADPDNYELEIIK